MTHPRILVVDDDSFVREALVELLADSGFQVVGQARDGVEAVELAVSLEPEVVVMDLRMPRMDGIDAARSIMDRRPHVQVVLLTAYDDQSLVQGAHDAGIFGYVVKGTDPAKLMEALREAHDKQQLLARLLDEPERPGG